MVFFSKNIMESYKCTSINSHVLNVIAQELLHVGMKLVVAAVMVVQ